MSKRRAANRNDTAVEKRRRKGAARAEGDTLAEVMKRVGKTSLVEVNQRALIDKMLARYAEPNSVIRELAQNADDAGASTISLHLSGSGKNGDVECTEMRVSNDGRPFTRSDWARVSKIAEGNPDENTVGMFGVGFYSVFSVCEAPCIRSDGQCLAFHWQGDQLAFSMGADPEPEPIPTPYTTQFVLSLSGTMTLSVRELASYLRTALFFSKNVQKVVIDVNGVTAATIGRVWRGSVSRVQPSFFADDDALRGPVQFRANGQCEIRKVEVKLAFDCAVAGRGERHVVKSFQQVRCECLVDASVEYGAQCHKVLKKHLPKQTSVALLFPERDDEDVDDGSVFVGMSTHQTTGCRFHLCAHLYPTIERENVDFATHSPLSLWNRCMTRIAGHCAALFYDARTSASRDARCFQDLYRVFRFAKSTPSPVIGELLSETFFNGRDVAVWSSRGALPASEALFPAHDIEALIRDRSLALVPRDHVLGAQTRGFFDELIKASSTVTEIDIRHLHRDLSERVLSDQELVSCITWYIAHQQLYSAKTSKNLFRSSVRFTCSGNEVKLSSATLYAEEALFRDAPLPPSCLPLWLTRSVPVQSLKRALSVKQLSLQMWVKFLRKDIDLFSRKESAAPALEQLSRHDAELLRHCRADYNALLRTLKVTACIPAMNGTARTVEMRTPAEVCLPTQAARSCESQWVVAMRVQEVATKIDLVDLDHDDTEDEGEGASKRESSVGSDSTSRTVSRTFLTKLGVRAHPPVELMFDISGKSMQGIVLHFASVPGLKADELSALRSMKILECRRGGDNIAVRSADEGVYFPWSEHAKDFNLHRLCWPGLAKEDTPVVKLLKKIGVRVLPTLRDLESVLHCNDTGARDRGLQLLMDEIGDYAKELGANKDAAVIPATDGTFRCLSECFLQECPFFPAVSPEFTRAAQSLKVMQRLGIATEPTTEALVQAITSDPDNSIAQPDGQRRLEYLAQRLDDFRRGQLSAIGQCSFLRSTIGQMVPPNGSYFSQARDYDGLVAVVECSDEARPFLSACGTTLLPTSGEMANALLAHHEEYFDSDRFDPRVYLQALELVASGFKALTAKVKKMLKSHSVMLAYEDPADDAEHVSFTLVRGDECFLVDNGTWKSLLKPKYVPEEASSVLRAMYEAVGSRWLTQAVREESSPQGKPRITERSKRVLRSIRDRGPLLLHSRSGVKHTGLRAGADAVLQSLRVCEVKRISRTLVFGARKIEVPNADAVSMCTLTTKASSCTLNLVASREVDYFDIGQEVGRALFTTHSDSQGAIIAQILNTSLESLSARGWPVARLLKQHEPAVAPPSVERSRQYRSEGSADGEPSNSDRSAHGREAVEDFAKATRRNKAELKDAIARSRAESHGFVHAHQATEERHVFAEPEGECRVMDEQRLKKLDASFNGIACYATEGYSRQMLSCCEVFSWYLSTIAANVKGLKKRSLAMFLDIDSDTVAFNHNGSLFFNIRYFYQCHFAGSRPPSSEILAFWFVVLCHELAHNVESDHNRAHGDMCERLIATHFAAIAAILHIAPPTSGSSLRKSENAAPSARRRGVGGKSSETVLIDLCD